MGGKTLAAIADEQGVDIADVQAAVQAAQIAETKTAIAQAVTDGTMTQDKADWLIEGLDAGYWGAGAGAGAPGGFGFGMGGHHGGGPRGFGGPLGAPNGAPNGAAPNSTTPNGNGTVTPNGTSF